MNNLSSCTKYSDANRCFAFIKDIFQHRFLNVILIENRAQNYRYFHLKYGAGVEEGAEAGGVLCLSKNFESKQYLKFIELFKNKIRAPRVLDLRSKLDTILTVPSLQWLTMF